MKFKSKLLEGSLIQRYKRFFADVELNNEVFTVHVPNTGSLKGVIEKSQKQKCWFSLHGDKTKKLNGTLEAVQAINGTWVGVNTSNPNRVVQEAIQNGIETDSPHFKHWCDYKFYKTEFKISKETRLDGVLCNSENELSSPQAKKHFIEIKNTTYVAVENGKLIAKFPDAVTERGQKHIKEMLNLIEQGHKAELIFTIQRDDVKGFAPAKEIDPVYANLLNHAISKGLIVSPVLVQINQDEVKLTKKILNYLDE